MLRNAKASQDRLRFRSPQQAGQNKWIDALVCSFGSNATEPHPLGCAALGDHDAPPIGHNHHGRRKMFGIDYQQGLIDDLAIGGHLPWQTLQGVSFCLDFDAANVAIDHGNIDPATAVIEAKFIDHQCVGTGLGMRQ